jgi:Zn-dependent protease
MDKIDWVQIAIFAVPVLIAITLHEAAHGFVALHYGDDTAKRAGRVTLNPLKHIDLFGTIILPLLLYITAGFVFGYAKPVPVNFSALKHPKRDMIWVAAAGPGMNVFLACVSGLLIWIFALTGGGAQWVGQMLLVSILMNFALALFNMLPIPPLDGSKVLAGLLPDALAIPYLRLGRFGFIILIGLIILLPLLGRQMGQTLDLFGTVVWRPAAYLTQTFLSALGLR